MRITKQNRSVWIFLGFLLLAGAANLLSRTAVPAWDALMTCVNYLTYIGLLFFWGMSVLRRLLPSGARTCILHAAVLMLFYMVLRIVKYRFAMDPVSMRYAVYAYWIPQLLIPAFFLMTCLHIRRGEQGASFEETVASKADASKRGEGSRKEKGLMEANARGVLLRNLCVFLPPCLLSLLVMANDLHALVYVPLVDLPEFELATGTYRLGPVFYLLYVWMVLAAALGLFFLFREIGHVSRKALRLLLAAVICWYGLILLNVLVLDHFTKYRLFNVPEIHIFSMLGVIEICIRFRLIPFNENYAGFFRSLRIPALITDRELVPAYQSSATWSVPERTGQQGSSAWTRREDETRLSENEGQMQEDEARLSEDEKSFPGLSKLEVFEKNNLQVALREPVELPSDWKLFGREIRAGYAFWAEDESAVHRAQERLVEANALLEEENDLIRAETEQKEKRAYLQSRHRIYHEIAAELYPCQKRIEELLEWARPGTDDFRKCIAKVSVLNAYVKRKTNLLLLAAEAEELGIGELFLALTESANYLTLAGLTMTAQGPSEGRRPAGQILALYDSFEGIAEQLLGKAPSLMVSWNGDGLRLAAEVEELPKTDKLPLCVRCRKDEGILYMDMYGAGGEK